MSVKFNFRIALLALTAASLAVASALPGASFASQPQAGEAAPPQTHLTPTVAATPTRTPTPTPQPTSSSSQVFDYEEIYYIAGVGGGEFCGNWEGVKSSLPSNARLPYLSSGRHIFGSWILCAYGFSPNRAITFELYAPDGRKAAEFTNPATGGDDPQYGRTETFDLSYGMPHGAWTVVARAGNRTAWSTFNHPPSSDPTIDIAPAVSPNTLHPYDPRWRMAFKQGDRAAIYGAGFRANAEVSLVVGRATNDYSPGKGYRMEPVIGWRVRTDGSGQFLVQFPIDRAFRDGNYVALVNESTGSATDGGEWFNDQDDDFKVFTPWRACQRGPLSNLQAGGYARLSAGAPNNVRNRPRLSARQLGQIQPYEYVRILDGPRCNDGYTWWQVEVINFDTPGKDLTGWTAEGNSSAYWLVPTR